MTRKYIDCREIPGESRCTVTVAADSEQASVAVALQHAVARHGRQDTPKLRQQLTAAINIGAPSA